MSFFMFGVATTNALAFTVLPSPAELSDTVTITCDNSSDYLINFNNTTGAYVIHGGFLCTEAIVHYSDFVDADGTYKMVEVTHDIRGDYSQEITLEDALADDAYIASTTYTSGTPDPETCRDGIHNQDETDIYTGGICTLMDSEYLKQMCFLIIITGLSFWGTCYIIKKPL